MLFSRISLANATSASRNYCLSLLLPIGRVVHRHHRPHPQQSGRLWLTVPLTIVPTSRSLQTRQQACVIWRSLGDNRIFNLHGTAGAPHPPPSLPSTLQHARSALPKRPSPSLPFSMESGHRCLRWCPPVLNLSAMRCDFKVEKVGIGMRKTVVTNGADSYYKFAIY